MNLCDVRSDAEGRYRSPTDYLYDGLAVIEDMDARGNEVAVRVL